jgi:uncharacterized membrane protein YphA (DoxX/SURF4 family)
MRNGFFVIQLSRFTIGLVWIYHGIFPKLYHIAPMELSISSSLGLPLEQTLLLIKAVGIGEIVFGSAIILFYRRRWIVLANIAGVVGLVLLVAVYAPDYLIEAFNPVTTNLPLVVLSLILLQELNGSTEIEES